MCSPPGQALIRCAYQGLRLSPHGIKRIRLQGKASFPLQPYPFYSARLIVGKSEECPDTIGAVAIMKKFIYVC